MGRGVPSSHRARLAQSASRQRLRPDQQGAPARAVGRDEGADPDAGRDPRVSPPAPRHL